MSTGTLLAHRGCDLISREELRALPVPESTRTFQPVPHYEVIRALIEALSFRGITVVRDQYAADPEGKKMFGVLDLSTQYDEVAFSIGVRNSNDKSLRLAMTVGYRVFVCDNLSFQGDFTPVLAKHSKSLSLIDVIDTGVSRAQRNFEPMKSQIEYWKCNVLKDDAVKVILYEAFIEGKLECPNLVKDVHAAYFESPYEEFRQEHTLWGLSNAFTHAFKELKPFQQFKATAKLNAFLQQYAMPF